MLLEILLLPIETTDMLLKEAPAWSTITSNKSFDITFLFTLPSLINTVLLVVAVSFLYSSPPATFNKGYPAVFCLLCKKHNYDRKDKIPVSV